MNRFVLTRSVLRGILILALIAAGVAGIVALDGWEWVGHSLHVLAHVKVFAALGHGLGLLGKVSKLALIGVVAASVALGGWWRKRHGSGAEGDPAARISSEMSSESPVLPPTVSDPPRAD